MEPNLVPEKLFANLTLANVNNSKCIANTSWKEVVAVLIIMGFVIAVLYIRHNKPSKKKKKEKQHFVPVQTQPPNVLLHQQRPQLPDQMECQSGTCGY